jgi:hypothetical protein
VGVVVHISKFERNMGGVRIELFIIRLAGAKGKPGFDLP